MKIKKQIQKNTLRISDFLKHNTEKSKTNKNTINKHRTYINKLPEFHAILPAFYSMSNPICTYLIHYSDTQSKRIEMHALDNIHLESSYNLPAIQTFFTKLNTVYSENQRILADMKLKDTPTKVRQATEDFSRNLSKFIYRRYQDKLPTKDISNAFIKIWECLSSFDLIPHRANTKRFNMFHICEAPGQMILACKYFTEQKRTNIIEYNWLANSLNPFNAEVKARYGNVFNDKYGLMRQHPKQWIWGADNTGDITNVKNIKWYRKYIREHMPELNMIVGDGGLGSGNNALVLQKLDLAQVVMVLACSVKGGSCIIKHFTPYMVNHPETLDACSFFVSFLYLYYLTFEEVSLFKPYSSDMTSGEFYVVGKGFKGIGEEQLDKLYKALSGFKVNNALVEKDLIPETFVMQVNGFIEMMANYNIQGIEKSNLLLTCYKEMQGDGKGKDKQKRSSSSDKVEKLLYCRKFLDEDKIEEILVPRYNKWIKLYQFV
jgi:hypothetical protein